MHEPACETSVVISRGNPKACLVARRAKPGQIAGRTGTRGWQRRHCAHTRILSPRRPDVSRSQPPPLHSLPFPPTSTSSQKKQHTRSYTFIQTQRTHYRTDDQVPAFVLSQEHSSDKGHPASKLRGSRLGLPWHLLVSLAPPSTDHPRHHRCFLTRHDSSFRHALPGARCGGVAAGSNECICNQC